MQYTSLEWLLWMIATFSLYWIVPGRWRQRTLVALSAIFVASHSPLSAAILLGFTLLTWTIGHKSEVSGRDVGMATVFFVLVLGYFKWGARGKAIDDIVAQEVIPLGISYYTFRCLHFLYERYRGRFSGVRPSELVGYLFFLPTFVVGPIHRFTDYQRDVHRIQLSARDIGLGLERILHGYVKIGFLANYLVNGKLGTWIAEMPAEDNALRTYLWIAQGGFNLYFQFSGYADIAIGFARLLGFQVMENFNWPYLQKNLSAYWRAWHISLTGWCREYVFSGVLSATRSPALGALATLLVIGLWHELSLRFLCWGLYHGLGLIAWQRFQDLRPHLPTVRSAPLRALIDLASVLLTVHYVWFGLVIVRERNLLNVPGIWKAATIGFLQ